METNKALNGYIKADAALVKAELAVIAAKSKVREAADKLLAESGKGPYLVNGEELFLNGGKGGSLFLTRKRGRKALPKSDPAAAASEPAVAAPEGEVTVAVAEGAAPEAEITIPEPTAAEPVVTAEPAPAEAAVETEATAS